MRMIREEVKCSACGETKGTFVYSEATRSWYCLNHPVAQVVIQLDYSPPIVER